MFGESSTNKKQMETNVIKRISALFIPDITLSWTIWTHGTLQIITSL